ncbi:hypothetical protein SASPL_154676 [Salvia splendens]|uniref:Uncharacterized protein n=1 Tax=Salvia splendens TaxID=180675 RepID=A0A8X8W0I5_SALSN|nr:hypothetical protein SASPL_154676 [Salvia splendens]
MWSYWHGRRMPSCSTAAPVVRRLSARSKLSPLLGCPVVDHQYLFLSSDAILCRIRKASIWDPLQLNGLIRQPSVKAEKRRSGVPLTILFLLSSWWCVDIVGWNGHPCQGSLLFGSTTEESSLAR